MEKVEVQRIMVFLKDNVWVNEMLSDEFPVALCVDVSEER